jgi:hypothetical protein
VARFYRLVRIVIDLLVLRGRTDRSKDVEILVLRMQQCPPTLCGSAPVVQAWWRRGYAMLKRPGRIAVVIVVVAASLVSMRGPAVRFSCVLVGEWGQRRGGGR